MRLEWDAKIGPASIIGALGSLSILVTLGVIWGTTTAKIDNAAIAAQEVKIALSKSTDNQSTFRDTLIADLRGISSLMQATVAELKAHENQDSELRRDDTSTRESFERRLLTLERNNANTGAIFSRPPPDSRRN